MFYLSLALPGNQIAQIKSDCDVPVDEQVRIFLGAYIPGCKILDYDPEAADIIIDHKQSDQRCFYQTGNRVVVYNRWKEELPFDIYHLLYAATRAKLIENGLFPVHASCVAGENGDGVVLVGHSGSGKSTTALHLVDEYGFKMVSGNKTVIKFQENSVMKSVAGTPTMTIRQSDREKFEKIISESVSYFDRLAFLLPADQYIDLETVKIRSIVLLHLQDGPEYFEAQNPLSAFHQLFHFFLDKMYEYATVKSADGVFVAHPPCEQVVYLAKHLKKALLEVPLYKAGGPISFISENINNLIPRL